MVATKRVLYREHAWEDYFNRVTPSDMDYVQHAVSSGVHVPNIADNEVTISSLPFLSMTMESFMLLLSASLETTVIVGGESLG